MQRQQASKHTFGVEHFFELQEHVSKLAHVADELHDVVWIGGGGVLVVRADRVVLGQPRGASRPHAGAGESGDA